MLSGCHGVFIDLDSVSDSMTFEMHNALYKFGGIVVFMTHDATMDLVDESPDMYMRVMSQVASAYLSPVDPQKHVNVSVAAHTYRALKKIQTAKQIRT